MQICYSRVYGAWPKHNKSLSKLSFRGGSSCPSVCVSVVYCFTTATWGPVDLLLPLSPLCPQHWPLTTLFVFVDNLRGAPVQPHQGQEAPTGRARQQQHPGTGALRWGSGAYHCHPAGNKHPLTLPKSIALLLPVSCKKNKKKNRQRAQSFMTRSLLMFIRPLIYCHRPVAGFVRLQMSLEMYSVKVQRFSGGLTSPSCLQAFLFFVCHGALFHGKAAH